MGQRLDLHAILEALLPEGSRAYFQPPANVEMVFPCIVYKRDDADTQFADNAPYLINKRYQVTVIDRNPDSEIPDKVAALPTCVFDRAYVKNNLNHDVYNLYF